MQEFYVQATRPTRADPLTHEEATALIQYWLRHRIIPSFEAEAEGLSADAIVEKLLAEVPELPASVRQMER